MTAWALQIHKSFVFKWHHRNFGLKLCNHLAKNSLSFSWNISNFIIRGIHIIFHTIYIYKQKFNTVQTATANDPLGPAEGQFCMSVWTCILHSPNVQWKYDWHLSVHKWPMFALTVMQVLGTIFFFLISKAWAQTEYSVTIPLINNIIQVITLWEPASQHFHCDFCIFILVHSKLLHSFVCRDIFDKYRN